MRKPMDLRSCALPNPPLLEARKTGVPVLLVREYRAIEPNLEERYYRRALGHVSDSVDRDRIIRSYGSLARALVIPGTPFRGLAVALWTAELNRISPEDCDDPDTFDASIGEDPYQFHPIIWRALFGYFEIHSIHRRADNWGSRSLRSIDRLMNRELAQYKAIGWITPPEAVALGYQTVDSAALPSVRYVQKSWDEIRGAGFPLIVAVGSFTMQGQSKSGRQESSRYFLRAVSLPGIPHLDMAIDFGDTTVPLYRSYSHEPALKWNPRFGCFTITLVVEAEGEGSPEIRYEAFARQMEASGWLTYEQMLELGFPDTEPS